MTTTILYAIIAVLAVAVFILLVTRPKVKTVSDTLPKDSRTTSKVLKLQNEIAPYLKEKDGKVYLKVVK